MDKKTQMLLGVAAVGVVAYLIWKKSQKPKEFMNLLSGPPIYRLSTGEIVFMRSTAEGGRLIFPAGTQVSDFFQQNGIWYGCTYGNCWRLTGGLGANQYQISGTQL